MSNFKINFQLQKPDKIKPFGKKPDLSLHWFGLTDGLLWINAGTSTIFEYNKNARKIFGKREKYNDYYLARFLEDFFGTFKFISEPIPKILYDGIGQFDFYTEKWLNCFTDAPDEAYEQANERYFKACSWRFDRSFDCGHLADGPQIACFRYGENIKIVWDSGCTADTVNIWTAPNGSLEINYDEFVLSVKEFFNNFFSAMERQVENAVNINWKKISLDKQKLVEENINRKSGFLRDLSYLEHPENVTNWDEVTEIYSKMKEDLKTLQIN